MLRVGFNFGKRLLRTSQSKNVRLQAIDKSSQESPLKDIDEVEFGNTLHNETIKKNAKGQGLNPDNPFVVASPTSKCIVGCSCEPESHAINWFYVNEGEPQTCSCGYFFKLDKVDATSTWVPEYSKIMYVDERRVDPRLQKREGILQKLFSKGKRNVVPPSSMKNNTNNTKVKS